MLILGENYNMVMQSKGEDGKQKDNWKEYRALGWEWVSTLWGGGFRSWGGAVWGTIEFPVPWATPGSKKG